MKGYEFWEEHAVNNLFCAYLEAGEWQVAEKMLFEREDLTGGQLIYDLSRWRWRRRARALSNDAVRLWSMKSNLDRRSVGGLIELAATKAREPLRAMYERMKKKDPLSFVPDTALKFYSELLFISQLFFAPYVFIFAPLRERLFHAKAQS